MLAACYNVGSWRGGETSEDPCVELGVGENFVKTQTEKKKWKGGTAQY